MKYLFALYSKNKFFMSVESTILIVFPGEGDIVRCFCCDLGLAEWDPKDTPWMKHARHSPTCWYLINQKGEQYVHDIQAEWKRVTVTVHIYEVNLFFLQSGEHFSFSRNSNCSNFLFL